MEPQASAEQTVKGSTTEQQAPGLGMPSGALDLAYQDTLNLFTEFKVNVTKPSSESIRYSEEGAGFYLLRVAPGPGVSTDRVLSRTDDLKIKLGLTESQSIRTYLDRGCVAFEVPKQPGETYPIVAEDLWSKWTPDSSRLCVPLGEDISREVVSIDFSSANSAHLLIAGMTGAGKSVALDTILRGLRHLVPEPRLRMSLVDPKGTELVDFEGDPCLDGEIGIGAEDAILALEKAVAEMERRYQVLREAKKRSIAEYNQSAAGEEVLPWHLVVLDEYADLVSDPDDKKIIEQHLARLAQKARAAGVHVIVATQNPKADIINTTIRSNLGAQLALRVQDGSASQVVLGEPGAQHLAGLGDAIFKTPAGTKRFQVAALRSRLSS
ncbi:MAG: FtsK/SpoIIIE domain-containing protein [Actinomycetes bacterium]